MIIYDDTQIANRPSDPLPNFEAIQRLNWGSSLEYESNLRTALRLYPDSVPLALDIENTTKKVYTIDELVGIVGNVRDIMRSENVKRPLGVYGQVLRGYWEIVRCDETPGNRLVAKAYRSWRDTIYSFERLYQMQDFLCPSLYTLYGSTAPTDKNIQRWKRFASDNVCILKSFEEFDKPIYAYMSILYQDGKSLVPAWLLKLELDHVKTLDVDAIIWFSGPGLDWTDQRIQDWWNIAKI